MSDTKSKPRLASLVGRPLLAGALAGGVTAPATALADIFVELQGIKGEVVNQKFKDQILALSYTQSFRNLTSTGSGGGAGAGKVVCGDITLLKNIDKASPEIIRHVVTGKHIDTGNISFTSSAGLGNTVYYSVALTDVLLTSIDQTDQNDNARIIERVTLSASKFDFTYTVVNAKGQTQPGGQFSFDCQANKVE
jgi:type VI secretion system secreted protein Hcp